jgi:mxaJ protein
MFFRFLSLVIILLTAAQLSAQTLTVCADPDNLPFSNAKGQGFENEVARLVARDLGMKLKVFPARLGRGFVRNVLNEGRCDLLIGIPVGFPQLLTTRPYYRSGYVLVSKRSRGLNIDSLTSPALKGLKIGVQIGDDEYAPPALVLARNGLQQSIVGFDTVEHPESILYALQKGDIDIAAVWGPLAGSYRRRDPSLVIRSINDRPPAPFVMSFDIAMGVRKKDTALRDRLNAIITRRKGEISRILERAGVPAEKEAD